MMSIPTLMFILAAYGLVSVITFFMYALDKRRAVQGGWRVRESTLHWAELLGGWPGAWVGQRVFQHKRSKGRYMGVFWGIVAIHVVAWGSGVWIMARG